MSETQELFKMTTMPAFKFLRSYCKLIPVALLLWAAPDAVFAQTVVAMVMANR